MRILQPADVMVPPGGYSQGVAASGEMVFVAGQVAVDREGNLVGPDDMRRQTRQTLRNVQAVLEAGGASLADVVKTNVYVTSFEAYREFDEEYTAFFGDHRPARATVKADLVLPSLLVEIEAIAVVSR